MDSLESTVPIEQLRSVDIRPGLVVGGFRRLQDFDVLAEYLARLMREWQLPAFLHDSMAPITRKPISESVKEHKPRTHFGRQGNFRLLLLGNEPYPFGNLQKLDEDHRLVFAVSKDLFSGNRSTPIGTEHTFCALETARIHKDTPYSREIEFTKAGDLRQQVALQVRRVDSRPDRELFARLRTEPVTTWRKLFSFAETEGLPTFILPQ
jgi:hypothetical protein